MSEYASDTKFYYVECLSWMDSWQICRVQTIEWFVPLHWHSLFISKDLFTFIHIPHWTCMPSSLLKVLFHKGLGWANEYADIHCICITILDWKYYSRVLTFIWTLQWRQISDVLWVPGLCISNSVVKKLLLDSERYSLWVV